MLASRSPVAYTVASLRGDAIESETRRPLSSRLDDRGPHRLESILNPIAFSILLTSLFVLRFRGWQRPVHVACYFAFFATLEIVATRYFLPPGAFGSGLGYLCLALTVPVLIAAYLIWRLERADTPRDEQPGE